MSSKLHLTPLNLFSWIVTCGFRRQTIFSISEEHTGPKTKLIKADVLQSLEGRLMLTSVLVADIVLQMVLKPQSFSLCDR